MLSCSSCSSFPVFLSSFLLINELCKYRLLSCKVDWWVCSIFIYGVHVTDSRIGDPSCRLSHSQHCNTRHVELAANLHFDDMTKLTGEVL